MTKLFVSLAIATSIALAQAAFAQSKPILPVPNESAIAGFGGYAGLMKLNLDFVARLKANKLIGSLFQDTDAEKLAGQLSDQFCEVLGGGCKYTGADMKAAHQGMGVKSHHFNSLAEDLQAAMDAAQIPQAEQFRLIAKLAPMKRDIVEGKTE